MGNEHGKEHDPNANGVNPTQPATGEKVKKPGKKPKKPRDEAANQPATAAPSAGKSTMLQDIDTSSLKHAVTDPIEDYYTVTEKVLGRYVADRNRTFFVPNFFNRTFLPFVTSVALALVPITCELF